MSFYLDSIFYSYAQIFFSNRRWFGVAALLITMIDPQVGLLGLMGVAIANGLAIYLNFDKEKIQKGFYGFNPILIAAAISPVTSHLHMDSKVAVFHKYLMAAMRMAGIRSPVWSPNSSAGPPSLMRSTKSQ